MFRKPKPRNIRQRQVIAVDDEDHHNEVEKTAESSNHASFDQPAKAEVPASFPKSVLSFDQEEEDDVTTFKLKKNKESSKCKKHKMRKKMKVEYEQDDEEDRTRVKVEVKTEEEEVIIDDVKVPRRPLMEDPTRIPDEETTRHLNLGRGSLQEGDIRSKFSSLAEIPDDKMIYAARKRRQAMREGDYQPEPRTLDLTEPMSLDGKHASRSRLVREDEHDVSDEEAPDSWFISSKNLIANEEEKRRNEQLEALRIEQGDSDDDENGKTNDSEDEELARWEKEQIKKAVSQRKITELKHEYNASRRCNARPSELIGLEEDMEIEIEDGGRKMPAFFNSDGTYRLSHNYHSFSDLIERLEIDKGRKIEDLKEREQRYETNQRNLKADQETVFNLAEMNGQLEKYFKLYQEMKFFTDSLLDCLNEKIGEINEIEALITDVHQTRAADLTRRRTDQRNRRKYEKYHGASSGWDSDHEENTLTEAFYQTMAKLMERAAMVFADVAPEYHDLSRIYGRFVDWLTEDPKSFREAYINECIPKVVGPLVRMELLDWNPLLPNNKCLSSMEWYRAVLRLGFDNSHIDVEDPAIVDLIPDLVDKIVIPKLTKLVTYQWDPYSTLQTNRLINEVDALVRKFPALNPRSKTFTKLLNVLKSRAEAAVAQERFIPPHLNKIVTKLPRSPTPPPNDDVAALLAQSKSVMR